MQKLVHPLPSGRISTQLTMGASPFASSLSLTTHEPVTKPAKSARPHERGPSIEEIDSLELPHYGLTQDHNAISKPFSGMVTHQATHAEDGGHTTPRELEASPPHSPVDSGGIAVLPSFWYPMMNKWRVLAACLIYFGNGINDAVNGALIPSMEDHYGIGYAVVSLIFVANAAGFILAAPTSNAITSALGRAKTLMLAEVAMLIGYVMIVCTPPFPAVVVAYLFLGFGSALNLALNNVFCANLANSTVLLGAAHGSYGVGGTVAPIIATAMVSNGILWSRFFLITIGLRIACFFFAGWAFWNYEREGINGYNNSLQETHSHHTTRSGTEPSKLHLLKRAISNKTTLIGALFIFSYQGAEVSESGWIITYLINRGGDPAKVGYVTAGFWAGITLGRFTLTHFAARIGEKRFVAGLTLGAIIFQILTWQIPNVVGGAVAVSILGFFLGPAYPCAMTVFARLLPGNLQMSAIAFMTVGGSSGGAIVPFTTGILAQAVGAFVLHPLCIAFFALMLVCWVALPRIQKRTD
jgi:fucose permease